MVRLNVTFRDTTYELHKNIALISCFFLLLLLLVYTSSTNQFFFLCICQDVGNYPICDSVEEDQQNSGNDDEIAAETAIESLKDEGIYIKSDTDESDREIAPDSPDKDVNDVEVPDEPQTNGCTFSEMLQIPGTASKFELIRIALLISYLAYHTPAIKSY